MVLDYEMLYDEMNYKVFEVASELKSELSYQGFMNDDRVYEMLDYIIKNYVTFNVYENEEEIEDDCSFCDDYEY